MKRQLGVLCLVCLTILGCASDKKFAPKEGRLSLQEEIVIPKAGEKIQLENTITPNIIHSPLYNAQNNIPNIKIKTKGSSWTQKEANKQTDNGILLPTPVTGKNNIYTLDSEFVVRAHQRTDGEMLWKKQLGNAKDIGISLVKSNDGLIALSQNGQIFALNFNGEILWQKNLKAPFRNNPTLYQGKIYLLSANNDVWVLNVNNGKENWHYKTQAPTTFLQQMGSPAVYEDTLIVPFSSGLVVAFDKDTGSYLWEQDITGTKTFDHIANIAQMTASPVIDNETVFLVGNANLSGAFDLEDARPIWTIPQGGQLTPIVNGNAFFTLTNENTLLALDKKTGDLFWQQALPEIRGKKGIYLLDNQIWLIGNEQSIILNAKDGKIINYSKSDINGSRPILTQDGWYYLQENGKLVYQGQ